MSIKDILVFLDESAPSEGRLRLAANIAQDHHACLSGVFVQNARHTRTPQDLAAPWLGLLGPPLVLGPIKQRATLEEQSATLAETAEQRFRDCLHSPKAKGDWYQVVTSRSDAEVGRCPRK
ncbi:MAG: hypothetical protein QOG73_637 [Acetobacteraceae bacterium]|jgi:hypothetical protein|nr:hypothetical protein [Acetobacteraceae bacterium]